MLSTKLKQLRENKNYTQQNLADKIGIARATYAHYEINRREPDISILLKIADIFSISIDELLERDKVINTNEQSLSPEAERLVDKVSSTDPETLAELEQYLNYLESKKNMKKIVNKT